MSHFAQLDENNIVIRVLVGDNESPDEGYSHFVETYGGTWVQTSFNGRIRKNYAGKGFYYDETRDAFIPPKPYPSWGLDEDTCTWISPIPYPSDGKIYYWGEDATSWIEVQPPIE